MGIEVSPNCFVQVLWVWRLSGRDLAEGVCFRPSGSMTSGLRRGMELLPVTPATLLLLIGVPEEEQLFKKPRQVVHKNTRFLRDPFSQALSRSQLQQAAALNAQVSPKSHQATGHTPWANWRLASPLLPVLFKLGLS